MVGRELSLLVSGRSVVFEEVINLEGKTGGMGIVLLEKEPVEEIREPHLAVKAWVLVSFLGGPLVLYWARMALGCGGADESSVHWVLASQGIDLGFSVANEVSAPPLAR